MGQERDVILYTAIHKNGEKYRILELSLPRDGKGVFVRARDTATGNSKVFLLTPEETALTADYLNPALAEKMTPPRFYHESGRVMEVGRTERGLLVSLRSPDDQAKFSLGLSPAEAAYIRRALEMVALPDLLRKTSERLERRREERFQRASGHQ